MKTFLLRISSPEGDLLSTDAVSMSVRGTEGELAIMADHIPFVTSVKPCDCKIQFPDGDVKIGHTQGGTLTVSQNKVVFLSGSFEWKN